MQTLAERLASLTPKQRAVFDYIRKGILRGLPPTYRDIARAFGFRTTNSVSCHIRALKQKGVLEPSEKHRRGFRLADGVTCPHCGQRFDEGTS